MVLGKKKSCSIGSSIPSHKSPSDLDDFHGRKNKNKNRNKNKKHEKPPPWRQLLYEFTQDTSLHGVRLTISHHVLRRIFWVIVVLGSLTTFVMIVKMQLEEYLSFPRIVNVEVIQSNELVYPAVTICNQNNFRRTEAFGIGIYDEITDGFNRIKTRNFEDVTECGQNAFRHMPGKYISGLPYMFATFKKVSKNVCLNMCTRTYSHTCNSIMYNKKTGTCYITSLTDTSGGEDVIKESKLFHLAVRNRCDNAPDVYIKCDFDGGHLCGMYQELAKSGPTGYWLFQRGPTSTPQTGPLWDHTSTYGQYLYVESTENRGMTAFLVTPFLKIKQGLEMCLMLHYSMVGEQAHLGKIIIRRRETNGAKKALALYDSRTREAWNFGFMELGYGLFQVEFAAVVGSGPNGDMAIDDVIINECQAFKQNCLQSLKGAEYMGNVSKSSTGKACLKWSSVLTQVESDKNEFFFPDGNITSVNNYCRNPTGGPRPWCYVSVNKTIEACAIPFCPCGENQFTCKSGQCINIAQKCDIKPHCADKSDESPSHAGCDIGITCSFNGGRKCGYLMPSTSSGIHWDIHQGRMENDPTIRRDASLTHNGGYAYFNSGVFGILEGQRVRFTSPQIHLSEESSGCKYLTFKYFISKMGWAAMFNVIDYMAHINVYRTEAEYVMKPLGRVYSTNDTNGWTSASITVATTELATLTITFEAVIFDPLFSDVGIDEIVLEDCPVNATEVVSCGKGYFTCDNGRCITENKTCDSVNTCYDCSDESTICQDRISLNCSFPDEFMCGYTDESDPSTSFGNWNAQYGGGQARTSEWMRKGAVKRLKSPWTSVKELSCLMYTFQITDGDRCELVIFAETASSRKVLGRQREEGPKEHGLKLEARTEMFRFVFEAACERETWMAMTLDDIKMSTGECVLPGGGAFQNECNLIDSESKCDFNDVSQGAVKWYLTDLGMLAHNTYSKIYAEDVDKVAVLKSPKFKVQKNSCFEYTMNVLMPNTTTYPGYIYAEVNNHTVSWHGNLNDNFEGLITGEMEINSGDYELHLGADLPYDGKIYFNQYKLYDGPCKASCDGFKCMREYRMCIPIDKKCDYAFDCMEGEDEEDCVWSVDGPGSGIGGGSHSGSGGGTSVRPDDSNDCTCQTSTGRKRRKKRSTCSCNPSPDDSSGPDVNFKRLVFPLSDPHADMYQNMKYVYERTGHQKQDMIFSCEWQGQTCTPYNDFKTQILDYGLCHTFNLGLDRALLNTSQTGSTNGLRLILNIEEYQYMAGPQDDLGVKMFVFNQSETPFVHDLGFAVGPGVHALVATKLSKSIALDEPYGNCSEVETYSACKRRFETKKLLQRCGCKAAYMYNITVRDSDWGPPDLYEKKPVCELHEYLNCVHNKQKNVLNINNTYSTDCDEPCEGGAYEPSLSYATLSDSRVEILEKSEHRSALQENVIKSLEIQQRTTLQFLEDLRTLRELFDEFNDLQIYINNTIYSTKLSVLAAIPKALDTLLVKYLKEDIYKSFEDVDKYQNTYDSSYLQLRIATDGLIATVATDSFAFMQSFFDSLGQEISNFSDVTRGLTLVIRLADKYLELAEPNHDPFFPTDVFGGQKRRCDLHDIKDISSTMIYGLGSLTDYFAPPAWDGSGDIDGGTAMSGPPYPGKRKKRQAPITSEDVMLGSELFSQEARKVSECIILCETALSAASQYSKDVRIQIPQTQTTLEDMTNIETITEKLDYYDQYPKITEFQNQIKQFYDGFIGSEVNKTKYNTAEYFSDERIEAVFAEFSHFQSSLASLISEYQYLIKNTRDYAVEQYIGLNRLVQQLSKFYDKPKDIFLTKARSLNLWNEPEARIEDPTEPAEKNNPIRIENLDTFINQQMVAMVTSMVSQYTNPLTQALTIMKETISSKVRRLETKIASAQTYYKAYLKRTTMNTDFFKRNFIAVDVFFAELKYMKIKQEPAYQLPDFFAGIGGYMGLLLGASVISIVEIFDFFIYNCFRKMAWRKKTAPVKEIEPANPEDVMKV